MDNCTGIPVRTPTGNVVIASENVYFSFGNGRLSYDCVACGAKCCRGFGYSVASGAEAIAHLQTRPALRLFLEPVDANGLRHSITNCAPSCFFLTDQNLCGLQVQSGIEAKPETCRLFPFNNTWCFNGYLVVSPHTTLCPLVVTLPSTRSDHSRYDVLMEGMRLRGVASDVVDAGPSLTSMIAKLVALERRIVEQSEGLLNTCRFDAFVVAQIEATLQAGFKDPACPDSLRDAEIAGVVARHSMQMTSLLGLTPAVENAAAPEVIRSVIATMPSIRAHIVFATGGRRVETNGTLWHLPFLSSALHLLVALAREAGMRNVTYLTVMNLFHSYRALLGILASLGSSMMLKQNAAAPWPLVASPAEERCYFRIIRGLISNDDEDRALGDILLDNLPPGSPYQRVAFLKRVSERLQGHIQLKRAGTRRRWRDLRYAIQRATFARMSDSVAIAAALKASGRRSSGGHPSPDSPALVLRS